MRVLRRRMGLSQSELAYILGYDSDSQVSRIENGSRNPTLAEVLVIELVFGVPAVAVFPEIRHAVGAGLRNRLKWLTANLSQSDPRLSYKTAQLERVMASLRTRGESEACGRKIWQA